MTSDRRTFIRQAALATAAGAAAPQLSAASTLASASTPSAVETQQPGAATRALDGPLLAAVGEVVLPESLGAAGRARAVLAFQRWIAGYLPVSEEMHGYGNQEITYTPPDPAPGWNAQLVGMDLLARHKHRRSLPSLDAASRNALVRAQLTRQRAATLPGNPLTAPHVAIALLAHWADSSEATDLAYGVRIQKENCRVLEESPRKPLPVAPGGQP